VKKVEKRPRFWFFWARRAYRGDGPDRSPDPT
jgi:hypothetical protein